MTISENICLALNKVFPYKKPVPRASSQEYTKTQIRWAEERFALIGKYLDLPGKTVLDAGCGRGGKTFFYSQKGVEKIYGVDIIPHSIEIAKECFGHVPNIEFSCGSITELKFKDNSFDYVILNDVFEHVDKDILEAALIELKRVVKPDGKILLEFPPWSSHDAAHLYDYISVPWCQLIFSDKTLENVVRKIAKEKGEDQAYIDRVIEHYFELNRITYTQSAALFKKINFKVHRHEKWVFFHWNFLRYIPIINNLVTKRVFAILGK